ncbi:hypothetical protein R6H26_14160 [Altericista sp. CCNU0014]
MIQPSTNLAQVLKLGCRALNPIKNLAQFFQIDKPMIPQQNRQLGHARLMCSID